MPPKTPLLWKLFYAVGTLVPLILGLVGVRELVDNYRFRAVATERAVAVKTEGATGRSVLRFTAADGRVIEVRGGRASHTWGMGYDVLYPPGKTEQARDAYQLKHVFRRGWFFAIAGLACAVLFPWFTMWIDRQHQSRSREPA